MVDNVHLNRRGVLFVLSSPSGAGKTTISRMMLQADKDIALSISVTTRPPRPGEVDGVDYHFVDTENFKKMAADGEFLEWAHVFGHRYGTPRAPVEALLAAGRDVLFDIDWQGGQQIRNSALGRLVVSIFLLPPSIAELEARLRARGQDDDAVIADRMRKSRDEISHWAEYDYVVINDDVDECFARVREILDAERMRRTRQTGLIPFVRELMG